MNRRAIIVLGMHRSGTSALTGVIHLLGAAVPADLLPPMDDNPQGYWESRSISEFNDRLLRSAGTHWKDDAAVTDAWFEDPGRQAERVEARDLLEQALGDVPVFVLKDPRLCRLLPFWQRVLAEASIGCQVVLMLRDPLEVARSLATRAQGELSRVSAVVATSRALLLWLRYVLEAERASRALPRSVMHFDRLTCESPRASRDLAATLSLPVPDERTLLAIGDFIRPSLRHHRAAAVPAAVAGPALTEALALLRTLYGAVGRHEKRLFAAWCDALHARLDTLVLSRAEGGRNTDMLEAHDPLSVEILRALAAWHRANPLRNTLPGRLVDGWRARVRGPRNRDGLPDAR